MRPVRVWTPPARSTSRPTADLASAVAADRCSRSCRTRSPPARRADIDRQRGGQVARRGDGGRAARGGRLLGANVTVARRERHRRRIFRFDPSLRLMSTVDDEAGGLVVNAKGAPEEVLARAVAILRGRRHRGAARRRPAGGCSPAWSATRRQGCGCSPSPRRDCRRGARRRESREDAERDLVLLGLVALFDPPRPEVAEAVARCHEAGIRIIVVTGDYGPTAVEIARRVGIGAAAPRSSPAPSSSAMSERELDRLLRDGRGAGVRPQLARGEAAHRRRPAGRGPRRRDDRRRRQRRAGPAARRHRRRDGARREPTSPARRRRWC